ncbi:hypothetical protein BH20ACT5_BH20ACT5_20780 [soil metagenome]
MVEVEFRPSRHGWHFANTWPRGAPVGLAGVTLARVYGGLCGGMCVLARDHWSAGTPIPARREVPADGPLTAQLWQGQLRSLDLPLGPLRYLRLQAPAAADARRRATLETLPVVTAQLRSGRPALLGLVRAVSWNPALSGRHHVVLAYRMRVTPGPAGERVELSVYDPNHPDRDRVRLVVGRDAGIEHTASSIPVYALLSLDS